MRCPGTACPAPRPLSLPRTWALRAFVGSCFPNSSANRKAAGQAPPEPGHREPGHIWKMFGSAPARPPQPQTSKRQQISACCPRPGLREAAASDQQPDLQGWEGRAEASRSPITREHRRGHQAPAEASEAGSSLLQTPALLHWAPWCPRPANQLITPVGDFTAWKGLSHL